MTPERWERVKELFDAALELPAEERPSFLAKATSGDEDLRAELERLLREHEGMGDFLEGENECAVLTRLLDLHTFAPGELISGRFRMVRFIGKGGMGEVYEAEDLDLEERVALKTIRPTIAADERVIARFKQEIQLSRKVTHPNVCRIFDIGCHRPASGSPEPWEEITYLTMELLPGETLAERLRRAGRMTSGEALPIVIQIINGLEAAHRAGIVHGDLKSSNVVLIPLDGGAVRAVVTDFGLARLSSVTDNSTGTSGPTGGTGTPAYMAPEQVERGTVTAAADIYSLGVVMFEMVTGTLPFLADTPTLVANKRLEEEAPSPRGIVSDLDRKWEAAILRCLERSPLNRFATAADVARSLHHSSWPWVPALRRRSVVRATEAALLLVLSVVGYYAYWASRPERKVQLAEAQIREGLARRQNGESKQAEAAFEEARGLYATARNRAGVVEALTEMGDLFRGQGDLARARREYESALAISREIGAESSVGTLLKDIGNVLHSQGDIGGAQKSYESALAIFRRIDDKRGIAFMLKDIGLIQSNDAEGLKDCEQALAIFKQIKYKPGVAATLDDVGGALDAQGHLLGAERVFEEELSIRREIGEKAAIAFAMGNLGDVLYDEGRLSEARRQFDGSLQIFRQLGSVYQPSALIRLGGVLFQEAELSEARKAFEEALALGYTLGQDEDIGNALLSLAKLSLEEARPSDAVSQARQAEEKFRLQKLSEAESRTLAVLAQALVAQRKSREAVDIVRAQIPQAMKRAPIYSYSDKLLVRITTGRVLAAAGNRAAGTKYLESALADTRRFGYLGHQFEARLGLGEIEIKSADPAAGRADLAALGKDAHAKGFALIARKAAAAQRRPER